MKNDWRIWLVIGATGFGGPAGQVAILHRELVGRRRWLEEDEFLAALRVCMLLPGPEAQQLASYAGWRRGGLAGGLLAGTLFVLPGSLLVTALAWLHAAGGSSPLIAAAFAGTRPAVVALVGLAAWRIGRTSLRSPQAVVTMFAALAALASGIAFPLVVLVAGALGCLLLPTPAANAGSGAAKAICPPIERRSGSSRWAAAAQCSSSVRRPPSPISLGAPERCSESVGPRLAGNVRYSVMLVAIAAVIWAGCYGLVTAAHAAGGRGSAIARLFTTTTLLSLGGAYAVVPWALDESVARGWLDADERFTAVAMGEATPGPLILVVTFIGFMAGWNGMPAAAAQAGLEGAAVATLFAFLPSFALIFALAPFVRSIHPGSWLGRAMTAVGAAVVAAILLLACNLAVAAFFPAGRLDPLAILVTGAAAAVLVTGRLSTPLVVLATAAVGGFTSLLR